MMVTRFKVKACEALTPIKIPINDIKLTEIHEMIGFEVLI